MEAVFQAVQANDIQKLRALVRRGANINARRASDNLTPLMAAIAYRDASHGVETETIAVLLELGAHPNEQFKLDEARTPLLEACLRGRSDVARLLVQHGADLSWHFQHSFLLHAAAQGGIDWLVRDMLEGGGDVNERDDEGHTPLHEAVYAGQVSICQVLIERGADVNARITGGTYSGYTPLRFALEAGFPRITEILLRADATASLSIASPLFNLLNPPRDREEPWPTEIKQDILLLLLQENRQELDASRFATDPWVVSARSFLQACSEVPAGVREQAQDLLLSLIKRNLYDAVAQGDEQEVRFLLTQLKERGLWEEILEYEELDDLLSVAAKSGSIPIVQMLLEHGLDSNTHDPDYGSCTALHVAIGQGQRELALWLIERGSDVNVWSETEGQGQDYPHTPLELAVQWNDERLVRRLLEAGAVVNLSGTGKFGTRDIDVEFTVIRHKWAVIEDIAPFDTQGIDVEAMEMSVSPISYASPAVMRCLLEVGADPNDSSADVENGGLLESTVAAGNDEGAQLLLEYGARFLEEEGAQKCLALALVSENEALLRLLLAQGIRPQPTSKLPPVGSARVRALLATAGIDAQQWSGSKVWRRKANVYLYHACASGRADKVRSLIEQGVGTRGETGGLKQLLQKAVRGYCFGGCSLQDCLATLTVLMDAGAKADQKLQLEIASDGFVEILRFLAERGVLAKDRLLKEVEQEPEGLLHEAAKEGQLEMVAFLLDELGCGADATVARSQSDTGAKAGSNALVLRANPCITPLHLAAKAGHTQMVRLLIEHGADINARDWRGQRPFDYAKCKQIRDVLRRAGALRGREEKTG